MELRESLVQAALKELGVTAPGGDDKYISWYNKETGGKLGLAVSWCAIFVSWCARQAGVTTAALPNYASCTWAVNTYRKRGLWRDRAGYAPRRGDLVFFDWDREPGVSEHTGIVTGMTDGWVHTVEGNSGAPGAVRQKSYALSSNLVLGYVAWDGGSPAASAPNPAPTPTADPVRTVQGELNNRYQAGLIVDGTWGPASKQAAVRAVQTELNRVYQKGVAVDGSFGPGSRAACPTLRKGDKNGLVWVLQALLVVKGGALALDSSFGAATETAVLAYQKASGLKVDGLAGAGTFAVLLA